MKQRKNWPSGTKMTALLTAAGMVLMCLPASACASSDEIVFTFSDSRISASEDSDAYLIDGTQLTVYGPGIYRLTGSCEDGSVVVDKNAEDVTLVLDDLELTSTDTAPVACGKNSEVTIELEGDNLLIDGEDPDDEDYVDDFEGAAIKVKSGASLTIDGDGTLEIDASDCKNGIKGASLSIITIEGGELIIDAANSALACDHQLVVSGGDFEITSQNDGLKSEPDADDEDSDGSITISGGTFRIEAEDDAIHGTSEVTITGGTFTITSGDDAIHAEQVLNIGREDSSKGPEITIEECVEGFEGAEINLYSGSGSILSSDDGINAANSDLTDYDFELNIYGGSWYVDAGGDGLDSNGDITISGGTTESYGASGGTGGDTAMDCDGKITVSGGTILTVDSSGITPAGTYVAFGSRGDGVKTRGDGNGTSGRPSNKRQDAASGSETGSSIMDDTASLTDSKTRFAEAQGNSTSADAISVSDGSELEIQDSSGRTLYETESIRNASSVMLASDELEEGETYTLYIDGNEAASAKAVTSDTASGNRGGGKGSQAIQSTQQNTKPVLPQITFLDVSALDWLHDAVAWAVGSGITSGTSATLFSPEEPCTRAQIAVFLWKAAGSPAYSSGLNPLS